MQIAQEESNGVTILGISGRLDTVAAESFQQQLLTAIGDRPVRLLLDFGQVEFISSSGLRVLVVVAKRVSAVKGKLLFCCVEGPVREVFELAGFTSLAVIFPSREAALAAVA